MKRKALFTLSALLLGLALGACSNTFNGAGRDIEGAGQAIQRAF